MLTWVQGRSYHCMQQCAIWAVGRQIISYFTYKKHKWAGQHPVGHLMLLNEWTQAASDIEIHPTPKIWLGGHTLKRVRTTVLEGSHLEYDGQNGSHLEYRGSTQPLRDRQTNGRIKNPNRTQVFTQPRLLSARHLEFQSQNEALWLIWCQIWNPHSWIVWESAFICVSRSFGSKVIFYEWCQTPFWIWPSRKKCWEFGESPWG